MLPIVLLFLLVEGCSAQRDVVLDLSGKHLTSVPDTVFDRKDVTFLDLGATTVTFYPPLSSLQDTDVNELTEIPERIGDLTNLRVLILNSNDLTSLPSIIRSEKLEVLDL